MTKFEIIEARPHHCGQMARIVRQEYRHRFEAMGFQPHRELRVEFDRSYFRRAWLIDGRLAALGGVAGTMAGSAGYVWLALSEAAMSKPLAVVREAKRQLAEIMETKTAIQARILTDDEPARRFALFMGFRPASDGMIEYRRAWPQVSDPFVVFSLPRSRSRWLSCFLASEGVECSHDLPVSVGSIDELCDVLQRGGSVETGLTRAWRILRDRFPGVRFAVVRRPVAEVERSAARFGWSFPDGYLEAETRRLAEISELPGTLTVDFDDMSREATCRALFEHCTGRIMAERHFLELNGRNIQIDMAQRMGLLIQNGNRLISLFDEIGRTITIQREDFDRFYSDGVALFRDHYKEAGSFDGLPLDPNVEMAKSLERQGQFLAMTARLGGEMIGYIVFLINPSFESRHVMLGFQNIFYVKPEHRGKLGTKLHKAAVAALKAQGVMMIIMRSGVRARGPSQKFLFQRMGAQSMGEIYSLPLVS
jgi:hypothetical protein